MVSKRSSIIVLAIVALIAIVLGFYTPKLLSEDDNYGDVTVQEAQELIGEIQDLVILDVRTVAEYDEGHIKDAINIPVDEISSRISELNKNDKLLVYCRTGNRSRTAVGLLEDAGFTKIYHMYEGISVWIQQGYPVVQ